MLWLDLKFLQFEFKQLQCSVQVSFDWIEGFRINLQNVGEKCAQLDRAYQKSQNGEDDGSPNQRYATTTLFHFESLEDFKCTNDNFLGQTSKIDNDFRLNES